MQEVIDKLDKIATIIIVAGGVFGFVVFVILARIDQILAELKRRKP